ncbi:MAG: iron-containing alcohol dehydrogenase [Opitutaceae bacterium]|nr:iron-containing alcohol dehydrogenase [Opitutaceae bacterium]
MSERLVIQSHKGPYAIEFTDEIFAGAAADEPQRHYIVDARVAELYRPQLAPVLASKSVLIVEAKEANKSLERAPDYVAHLMGRGIKRGHVLVAIGGGIIQDITCFLAAVLLRGVEWHFYPTTLLAQADSCIGSKSSINVGQYKNVVGTYTPPARIGLSTAVLQTLPEAEIRSGIGEMLKVHMIAGPNEFDRIAADYGAILADPAMMRTYILRSLEIKKGIIERDEFDRGIRNVMNLGHSFGHAIESATDFGVPHGIAVTIGIDMANFTAVRLGRMAQRHFDRMHPTLRLNYRGFERTEIPAGRFFAAIAKDKKNTDAKLGLILPDAEAVPRRVECANDEKFQADCCEYIARIRTT